MKTRVTFLSAFMALIVGCSSVASHAQEYSGKKALEALYGIAMIKNAVELKVKSTGCTTKEDFVIELKFSGAEAKLEVVRTKPDMCRRMPKIITITKTLDYSAIEPNLSIMLLNPLKASHK